MSLNRYRVNVGLWCIRLWPFRVLLGYMRLGGKRYFFFARVRGEDVVFTWL